MDAQLSARAFAALLDPVLITTGVGALVDANDAARRWFGADACRPGAQVVDLMGSSSSAPDRGEGPGAGGLAAALAQGRAWQGGLRCRSADGAPREATVQLVPLGDAPAGFVVHIRDQTGERERARAEADAKRADLLVDLLGATASELGDAVTGLHWAARLSDDELAQVPARMRAPLDELRGQARRLHELFRNLSDNLPQPPAVAGEAGLLDQALAGAPEAQVLLAGAAPVDAARWADALRAADLPCRLHNARDREQTVRAAIAGEADVVLLGGGFSAEEKRDLVRKLAQSAPNTAVFDPDGVDPATLIRGLRGALRDRGRRDRARDAWRSIEEIALRDPLTGALNRRALERFGRLEVARAERYSFPLALAIFDMDHFKELNDNFGHPVGDRALTLFADALRAGVREMDVVARLGGDEFVVLMPHTDPAGAWTTVRRLREAAERAVRERLPEAQPQPGASAGFAVYPDEGVAGFEELMARADAALYRAKRARPGSRPRRPISRVG